MTDASPSADAASTSRCRFAESNKRCAPSLPLDPPGSLRSAPFQASLPLGFRRPPANIHIHVPHPSFSTLVGQGDRKAAVTKSDTAPSRFSYFPPFPRPRFTILLLVTPSLTPAHHHTDTSHYPTHSFPNSSRYLASSRTLCRKSTSSFLPFVLSLPFDYT